MSGRTPAQRALPLTDAIYAAASDPPAWTTFLEQLSGELGGAAIAMSVMLPGWDVPPEYYRVNLSERFAPAFERHLRLGLPWPLTHPLFRAGFARGSAILPDSQVPGTGYYLDYMEPQGLAPEGPVAHLIVAADERPLSGIAIQRCVGGRPFDDADLAMCNLLVPHLALATRIRHEWIRNHQENEARTHILDRFRVGIVILDLARRAIVTNRSAQAILHDDDGLFERGGVIHARSPTDEWELQRLTRELIHYDGGDAPGGAFEGRFLAIRRPSGKPSYAVGGNRLFASPRRSAVGDEVAALFITDPSPGQIPYAETFRHLFELTQAEAEVVSLLAAGHSLEEISRQRGVAIATTRTLLKRVYAKTRASRQGELIRLVLASDAPIADLDGEDTAPDAPDRHRGD